MSDNVIDFHNEETRLFELPDGSTRLVRMSELFWWNVRLLYVVEGYTEKQIAAWAFEEMELQQISFNDAVKCVVAFLGNNDAYWDEGTESQ